MENDQPTYLHNDLLGSPVAATDAFGMVTWQEHYTPYGEKWQRAAANDDQASFTGHIADSATGLTYMQARYYDPVIGRFLSNDPVGFAPSRPEYFNRYAYVGNDPVNKNDPTGEFANFVIGAVIGVAAEAVVQTFVTGEFDGGELVKSAFVGAISGGVGGATAKLAGSIGRAVASPASAMHQGASKVVTGTATGAVGGAAGGAAGEATKQVIKNGKVDNPQQLVKAAVTGAVTGGLAGAGSGSIQANAAQKTLGDSRAQTVFTSTPPGEKTAAAAGALTDLSTSTADAVINACKPNQGGC